MEEEFDQLKIDKIINILQSNKQNGIGQDELIRSIGGSNDSQLAYLNRIIELGYLKFENSKKTNQMMCFYQDPNEIQILQYLSEEETILFKLVKESQNKGIDSKSLKTKSKINPNQINKCLKKLERDGIIKAYKDKQKKLWLLYDQELDQQLTGGAFFISSDQVNQELVNLIYSNILHFISEQKDRSANKQNIVANMRNEMNKYEMNENNIMQIIEILKYDEKIEQLANHYDPKNPIYKLQPIAADNPIEQLPCGVCPVQHQCKPGGFISPTNCIYFDDW